MCSWDRERNDVERLGRGQWLRRWHLENGIKKVTMIDYGHQQDTICFQKVFCLISYKTFQVDSLCRRCSSRALMTSSRLWIFNRCIFHIISSLLSNKYICQVFDDTKTSRFLDFNRLPSNIIKRGCLAAPIKKFFNLEVVKMIIEMTILIIKEKMRDDENFKQTRKKLDD